MTTGPWTDYSQACLMWGTFVTTRAIDGRRPVAIERRNHGVRLLYDLPTDGREAVLIVRGLPEYIAADPEWAYPVEKYR